MIFPFQVALPAEPSGTLITERMKIVAPLLARLFASKKNSGTKPGWEESFETIPLKQEKAALCKPEVSPDIFTLFAALPWILDYRGFRIKSI